MLVRYLLDTNTVSCLARNTAPFATRQFRRVRQSSVLISVISEAELLFGLAKKPEATRLAVTVREFISDLTILPWDSKAAHEYAQLRATLGREGRLMGGMDLLIAAHALAENLVLVTNDAAFRRVEGLKIEDWTAG